MSGHSPMSYNQGEMAREYVERRERGCYLIGSRVSLESIVSIDTHLRRGEKRFDELARASREANPLLYAKLEAAKNAIAPRR